jgi:membrane-bound lytic murein transglycosylase F
MVVPPSRELLIPWLNEGRGDIIAAAMTPSPERKELVEFTQPYLFTEQMVVRKAGTFKDLKTPADLKGKKIHVRKGSIYRESLRALEASVGGFEVVEEADDVETEELLARVSAGKIPLTLADSHVIEASKQLYKNIEAAFPLDGTPEPNTPVAFAVRKTSPKLLGLLDEFVKKNYRGLEYNILRKRYFEAQQSTAVARRERASQSGTISPFDTIIRRHAKKYGFDWRLLVAQAYHESKFDPKAMSWVGARGLFQVMPRTAAEMGYKDLEAPEQGIAAGIEYMGQLFKRFDPALDLRQRVRFTLAAYNVGLGHVYDARRLAKELGLDPNRWFQNVEKAMLLLEKPEYAKRARNGYCRGSEAVGYVSKIQTSFDAYAKVLGP